jgi:hypothetical protein
MTPKAGQTMGRYSKVNGKKYPTLWGQAMLSGWPTPNTPNGGRSVSTDKMDASGQTADGRKHTASLEHAVKFATWASPRGTDAKCGSSYTEHTTGKDLAKDATLTGWPTPRSEDSEQTGPHRGSPDTLNSAAKTASWATPSARDEKGVDQNYHDGAINNSLPNQVAALGTPPASSPAPTAKPVACRLNPLFSLWLMLGTALATAWASCAPQATRLPSRPQRPSSAP